MNEEEFKEKQTESKLEQTQEKVNELNETPWEKY